MLQGSKMVNEYVVQFCLSQKQITQMRINSVELQVGSRQSQSTGEPHFMHMQVIYILHT
jgi:hypothetical protein